MGFVAINAITVPEGSGDELARRFAARAGAVDNQEGFEGFELLRPEDAARPWLVVTHWRDKASFEAWVSSPSFGHGSHGMSAPADASTSDIPHSGHARPEGASAPVAMSSELWTYEVAQ